MTSRWRLLLQSWRTPWTRTPSGSGVWRRLAAMASERSGVGAPAGVPSAEEFRVATWNMSHWSAAKAAVAARDIGADLIAIQETHPAAPRPLEEAHTAAERLDLHLHHGRPAETATRRGFG